MAESNAEIEFIKDYVTGKKIALVGAEENRQTVARRLIAEKGYDREDLRSSVPISVAIGSEFYHSKVDLVIVLEEKVVAVIKCAAGSLGSREREAVAAARLLAARPIALAVVSDGQTATVLDAQTGKILGKGWESIPTKEEALKNWAAVSPAELPPERRRKEALIFRSYDSMNVNVL